jgi:hypothetical protein
MKIVVLTRFQNIVKRLNLGMLTRDQLARLLRHRVPLLFLLLGLLASCAPTHYVRPLQKNELAITGTLGGSVFTNFGYPMPVPNTTIGAGYGITEKLTGYASLYPTSMAFGVLQFDLGATYGILQPNKWRPGLSVSPGLNLAGDVWESHFKIWPQLDANAYWNYGKHRNFVYAGLSSWYELAAKRSAGQAQPQFILPGFQVGHTLSGKRLDFTVELKVNNVVKSNQDLTISWLGMGNRGAMGIYFGLSKRFGK